MLVHPTQLRRATHEELATGDLARVLDEVMEQQVDVRQRGFVDGRGAGAEPDCAPRHSAAARGYSGPEIPKQAAQAPAEPPAPAEGAEVPMEEDTESPSAAPPATSTASTQAASGSSGNQAPSGASIPVPDVDGDIEPEDRREKRGAVPPGAAVP